MRCRARERAPRTIAGDCSPWRSMAARPSQAGLDFALRAAARAGKGAEVSRLLAAGANANAADADNNYTPLHVAALLGHADVLQLLLRAGAHTDVVNAAGSTVLTHRDWQLAREAYFSAAFLAETGFDDVDVDAASRVE
ncbi:MAG: ankyrin repeat domain-containing protein, partial [Methanosarcinales archaeon]